MAVLAAALLLTGCERHEAPPAQAPVVEGASITLPAGAMAGIRVEPVRQGAARSLALPGRLMWNEDRTARVGSPFAGRVTTILAEPGSTVRVGQPLAVLASPEFSAAQADARKAGADAELAARALARQRELHDAGIIARKEFDLAQAEAARADAERRRAEAVLRQTGGTHAAGDPDAEGFVLRAPIAGLVVARNVNPGMEVRPDQGGEPLFLITDPSRLWAQIDANEADLRLLRSGGQVQIESAAYPGERFAGTVVKIADFVDPAARSVKVRLDVPNPERRMKAEMFVTARLEAEAITGTAVPDKAVYLVENRHYAFVRRGERRFERREIQPGVTVGGITEVKAGLQDAAEVVTDGNLYLQDLLRSAQMDASVAAPDTLAAGQPRPQPAAGESPAGVSRADVSH
ncbi:efflux RND transporter periplasmic adaptor subunit [Cupriavidus sp. AU9028]|uniref:efflux RND transporter periplasmic adaptor subunit n=1 Tax=Cupriavidus sp. AU9028 TaxID=2871157 RepID=UPI002103AD34|nr:efflux RND transporter periplasmic adaptor subunit [Cupriavidus sp. AU9028]